MWSSYMLLVYVVSTPLVLHIAATEASQYNGVSDFAKVFLEIFNASVLLLVFFKKLGALCKFDNFCVRLGSGTCIFVLIWIIQESFYGNADNIDNIVVLRCFAMFTFLSFDYQTITGNVFSLCLSSIVCDCILSIHVYFCEKLVDAEYKLLDGCLFRISLMSLLSFPHVLHFMEVYNIYTYNQILGWMYKVAYIVKELLFLATLLQLVILYVSVKRLDNEHSYFFQDHGVYSDIILVRENFSLVYFFMHPFIDFALVSHVIGTYLTSFVTYLYINLYQVIVERLQKLQKILFYVFSVILNAILFAFFLQSICSFALDVTEQTVEKFESVEINLANENRTWYGKSSYESLALVYDRHIGEDVALHCFSTVDFNMDRVRIIWTYNNTIIDSLRSDRINISYVYGKSYVESTLTIMLIEKNDFGNFTCFVIEETDGHIPTFLGSGFKESILFELINVTFRVHSMTKYELHRKKITNYVYEIDAGTFVVFELSAYVSVAKLGDVYFQYTVNGLDILEICVWDLMSCYSLAYLRKNFWDTDRSRLHWKLRFGGLFKITVKYCACSKIFGVHKLVIFRDYFNRTLNKTEFMEIEHPAEFYFLPRDNDTGIRKNLFINNSREFISHYLDSNDQIVIPTPFRSRLRFNVYFFYIFLSGMLYIVSLYFLYKALIYAMYFYCSVTIIPLQNMLIYGSIRQPLPSIERKTLAGIEFCTEHLYDVYLSYSENDYYFSKNVILSYVEKECKKRVCFPHRDLAHEAAATRLHLYSKATQQSKKYIIILSNSYINDSDCNGLQFLTCIHPLITEKNRNEKELLIVKIDREVELPVQITGDSRIHVIDWVKANDLDHNLREIKHWLRGYRH